VIIRGIERRKMFQSNDDRENFITRLSELIPESKIDCHAWALLSNHGHFLLKTGSAQLSVSMSRLLIHLLIRMRPCMILKVRTSMTDLADFMARKPDFWKRALNATGENS